MPYKGGKRTKAQLTYDYNKYTPQGLTTLLEGETTEKDLRKEYSRLRSIARKRVERMGKTTEYGDSQSYAKGKQVITPLKEVKTEAQLRHKLSELAHFVHSDRGSIKGQNEIRDKAIASYNDHGYDFVNKKNFKKLTKFLDRAREINKALARDSEQLVEYFELLQSEGLSDEQMEEALQNLSRSKQTLREITNNTKRDHLQFRQSLE